MAGGGGRQMKFRDWYLKIGAVSMLIGASMELFMIHTGFCMFHSMSSTSMWVLAEYISAEGSVSFAGIVVKFGPVPGFLENIRATNSLIGKSLQIRHPEKSIVTAALSDDKVTILESEKRAWESSAEGQAIKEALNPWGRTDEDRSKS